VEGKQRVELNAFTSDDFVRWLEGKLKRHKVEKVIPDDNSLGDALKHACYVQRINARIAEIEAEARQAAEQVKIPKDLRLQLARRLKSEPEMSWDQIIARIARL
jgi:hypothetical protein